MTSTLFGGKASLSGGLDNERELYGLCPSQFKKSNIWSERAMQVFFGGANVKDWKWRDASKKTEQLLHFKALLGSFAIPHEQKEAVAGWMLSEMLSEVPK